MMTYKKLLFALIGTAGIAFTSCSSDNEDMTTNEPQMVNVKLDFTFEQSGDMTRASGAETYAAFYEKYIKTKQLTPKNFSLTFKNKETNETILTKNGTWESENGIQLPEGTYTVTGTSHPQDAYLPSDTAYISFSEEVEIKKEIPQLTLTAKYSCFLLLFDATNIDTIKMGEASGYVFAKDSKYAKTLSKDEKCHWIFMYNTVYYDNWNSSQNYSLIVQRDNVNMAKLYTATQSYQDGKYYFYQYNDMSTGFTMPEMEPGN